MKELKRFIPISKVDDEERMVYGYASTPDLDSQGERVDIEALKKALPEYLKFPTIREMHMPNAVGTTKEAKVDSKGLFIGAKIIDDMAWKKIKEGVFRGFSIGGKVLNYVDNIITDLFLTEISVVDVPANRQAVFTLFKRDETHFAKFVMEYQEMTDFYLKGVRFVDIKKNEEEVIVPNDQEGSQETQDTPSDNAEDKENNEESKIDNSENTEASDKSENEEKDLNESDESDESGDTKEVSEKIADLSKFDQAFSKFDSLLSKFDSVLSTVESLEKRLSNIEKASMPSKTQASYVASKNIVQAISREENDEVAKAREEYMEILKIRDTDLAKYHRENLSERAFSLKDKYKF